MAIIDTLIKAEEAIKKGVEDMESKFCSIILTKCRKDCHCFYPGRSQETKKDGKKVYYYYNASCTHPFIVGEIGIQS